MNAVIDEDLPRSFGENLSKLGFKIFDIRDHNLRGSSDRQVFNFAQRHKAILFSADLDFSSIIDFPPGKHYGICILRFPNEMSTILINKEIQKLLQNLNSNDYKGNLIILSPAKIRLRRPSN